MKLLQRRRESGLGPGKLVEEGLSHSVDEAGLHAHAGPIHVVEPMSHAQAESFFGFTLQEELVCDAQHPTACNGERLDHVGNV